MICYLKEDLKALSGGSLFSVIKCFFLSHSFHLIACYRIGGAVAAIPVLGRVLRPFFEYFIRIVFSSDISLRSKIGPGLIILHGHDIVIGANVIIGSHCKIFNGVTLGNKNTETGFSVQPIVGDNVVLSTGCKVLGGINIGSNSLIGANSVVLINVPPSSIAVGVPATVKRTRVL